MTSKCIQLGLTSRSIDTSTSAKLTYDSEDYNITNIVYSDKSTLELIKSIPTRSGTTNNIDYNQASNFTVDRWYRYAVTWNTNKTIIRSTTSALSNTITHDHNIVSCMLRGDEQLLVLVVMYTNKTVVVYNLEANNTITLTKLSSYGRGGDGDIQNYYLSTDGLALAIARSNTNNDYDQSKCRSGIAVVFRIRVYNSLSGYNVYSDNYIERTLCDQFVSASLSYERGKIAFVFTTTSSVIVEHGYFSNYKYIATPLQGLDIKLVYQPLISEDSKNIAIVSYDKAMNNNCNSLSYNITIHNLTNNTSTNYHTSHYPTQLAITNDNVIAVMGHSICINNSTIPYTTVIINMNAKTVIDNALTNAYYIDSCRGSNFAIMTEDQSKSIILECYELSDSTLIPVIIQANQGTNWSIVSGTNTCSTINNSVITTSICPKPCNNNTQSTLLDFS